MPTYNDYDLNMVNDRIKPVVHVKQYDNNNRVIRFTLYNGDEAYAVPAGTTVTCRGLKKSGNAFTEACSFSNNVVSVVVTTQMSILSGRVPCELRLTSGTNIIGSMNFFMDVEENPIEDAVIDDDEMTTVEQLIQALGQKQDAPTATGTAGQVLTLDSDLDPVWADTGVASKQDAPAVAGTNGQVLGLDANLDPVWITPSDAVDSVNGQTGTVVLTASDVGAVDDSSYETWTFTLDDNTTVTKKVVIIP